MKHSKLFISLFSIFFLSCFYDRDDLKPGYADVNEDIIFESEDGEMFYTGLECNSTGDFFYNPDTLPDVDIEVSLQNEIDLSIYLPPIGNQGKQGSCVSWAISYYMRSMLNIMESGENTASLIMSPAYTYNQITQGNCSGTAIIETLELIKEKGVCPLNVFPYTDSECITQPTEKDDEIAKDFKISDYKNLGPDNLVMTMKVLLSEQTPIVVAAFLSKEFGKIDEFGLVAYRPHSVSYENGSCHAMLVVGYSDEYNAFKVVNSWGEAWGNNGFIWIDYQAFENTANENAEFRVIKSAHIAYND